MSSFAVPSIGDYTCPGAVDRWESSVAGADADTIESRGMKLGKKRCSPQAVVGRYTGRKV